jgi:hypothetical protein
MPALNPVRNQISSFSFAITKNHSTPGQYAKDLKKSRNYGKKHLAVRLSNPRQNIHLRDKPLCQFSSS